MSFWNATRLALLGGGGGRAPFDPLSLEPFAWYDPSDLATLFTDHTGTTPVTADGDAVEFIQDKSGNTRSLTPFGGGGDANRPLYHTSGGVHWLEADGSNDYLGRATGFDLDQPCDIVIGLYQVTRTFLDRIFGQAMQLYQHTSTPTLRMRASADVGFDFATETWGVITARFNGASSALQLNNQSAVTGDAGTGSLSAFTLFAESQSGGWSNVRISQCLVYPRLSDANLLKVQTYVAGKSGVFF